MANDDYSVEQLPQVQGGEPGTIDPSSGMYVPLLNRQTGLLAEPHLAGLDLLNSVRGAQLSGQMMAQRRLIAHMQALKAAEADRLQSAQEQLRQYASDNPDATPGDFYRKSIELGLPTQEKQLSPYMAQTARMTSAQTVKQLGVAGQVFNAERGKGASVEDAVSNARQASGLAGWYPGYGGGQPQTQPPTTPPPTQRTPQVGQPTGVSDNQDEEDFLKGVAGVAPQGVSQFGDILPAAPVGAQAQPQPGGGMLPAVAATIGQRNASARRQNSQAESIDTLTPDRKRLIDAQILKTNAGTMLATAQANLAKYRTTTYLPAELVNQAARVSDAIDKEIGKAEKNASDPKTLAQGLSENDAAYAARVAAMKQAATQRIAELKAQKKMFDDQVAAKTPPAGRVGSTFDQGLSTPPQANRPKTADEFLRKLGSQ